MLRLIIATFLFFACATTQALQCQDKDGEKMFVNQDFITSAYIRRNLDNKNYIVEVSINRTPSQYEIQCYFDTKEAAVNFMSHLDHKE